MRQIQAALEQATAFSRDVATLANTMNSIAAGEGQLTELQALLTRNLRVLHETNQIDRAFHSLTAAIHLLTMRSSGAAIRDAA
jgi:hypothetical protein